jgi:hypothetical protein
VYRIKLSNTYCQILFLFIVSFGTIFNIQPFGVGALSLVCAVPNGIFFVPVYLVARLLSSGNQSYSLLFFLQSGVVLLSCFLKNKSKYKIIITFLLLILLDMAFVYLDVKLIEFVILDGVLAFGFFYLCSNLMVLNEEKQSTQKFLLYCSILTVVGLSLYTIPYIGLQSFVIFITVVVLFCKDVNAHFCFSLALGVGASLASQDYYFVALSSVLALSVYIIGNNEFSKVLVSTVSVAVSGLFFDKFSIDSCILVFAVGVVYLYLYRVRTNNLLSVKYAQSFMPKGDVCGDYSNFVNLGGGKFLMTLCDGMGSGEQAFSISKKCTQLVEKLFLTNMPTFSALQLTNDLLITEQELYSSMDIAIFDTKEHTLDIFKFGSPKSIVCQNSKTVIINGLSLPMGMLAETKPIVTKIKLKAGDLVVFATDGITDRFDGQSLAKLIFNFKHLSPEELCKLILDSAGKSDGVQDDMSVVIAKLETK